MSKDGLILSAVGRSYKTRVSGALRQKVGESIDGDLAVSIEVWFPDPRRRDLDNLLKPILDVCTRGNVWGDDVQFRDLQITLRGIRPGRRIQLTITPLEKMLF
jgi:crossover junction endodeoxyribonuclease RusA